MTAGIFSKNLSSTDFSKLKTFIESSCGIKLTENKKNMVEGRLRKRVKALNLASYKEYLDYALDGGEESDEKKHLIDAITTNKTDFFRENNHFEMLSGRILPQFASAGLGSYETLNVWSCASSTGEEPYTLAMVLSEYFGVGGKFRVIATDINTAVLNTAKKAIYSEEKAKGIPSYLVRKYMLRSKNREDRLVRFKPEIRSKVHFERNNLKSQQYVIPSQVDIAFCRNVIIYFDAKTQEEILNRICSYIKPGGFLFMGHSESIHGLKVPVRNYAPTIYVKD